MENDSLINACILDGAGGKKDIDWQAIEAWSPGQGKLWVHLNYEHPETQAWLRHKSGLDRVIVESLLAEETRPRCANMGNGLLINLRGVNTNPGSEPEDMVSIRLFCDGERIISTRRRRLLSIRDIVDSLEKGTGPKNPGELIASLTSRLIRRMSDVVAGLDDSIDSIEEEIITDKGQSHRGRLVGLRRELILLRRYLAPQREALNCLQSEKAPWLSDHDRLAIRESGDRLVRYLEDLDSCRDRAAVTYDELSSKLSEEMNTRMYVLSIVAALFLPLGFLTGLFGINVGGMPLAEDPLGFWEISALMVVIVIAQVIIFRMKRWF